MNKLSHLTVFLDMDEVISDFRGRAYQVHNTTRDLVEAKWTPGEWDICTPLAMTPDWFWKRIHEWGEGFWTGIDPMPWARELVNLVEKISKDWYVVTSPSRNPTSLSGKQRWCNEYFNGSEDKHFPNMIPTPHKHLLSMPNTLLIDDREETVKRFNNAGEGKALLFPSLGNSLHEFADDPMSWLIPELLKVV